MNENEKTIFAALLATEYSKELSKRRQFGGGTASFDMQKIAEHAAYEASEALEGMQRFVAKCKKDNNSDVLLTYRHIIEMFENVE